MPSVKERGYPPDGFFTYKFMLISVIQCCEALRLLDHTEHMVLEHLKREKPNYSNIILLKHNATFNLRYFRMLVLIFTLDHMTVLNRKESKSAAFQKQHLREMIYEDENMRKEDGCYF